MNRQLLTIAAVILFGAAIFVAQASSPFDIEFPIPELGGCADKNACKAYCDDLAHKNECIEFAQKHGLVDEAEADKGRDLPPIGPGGCRSEAECRSYCDDSANLDECLAFAQEHNLVSEKEIKQAREFKGQTGPGECRGANECRAYCEDPAHQKECLEFSHRKGLISDQRAEIARQVIDEGGPGGCRGEDECRSYCEDPAHIDECLAFAERHGFVNKEDAARIRKAGFTTGPGGCKGEECRTYCEDPAHHVECIEFAEKNGLMSREEAERAKKFAGKTGPGGCRGEECREFCENPANAEQCLEFAAREGLMPPEELERARKFIRIAQEGGPGGCQGREQCEAYCHDSANGEACFEFAKKQGLLPPGAEKDFEAGLKIQKVMREQGGPGGCRTDQECQVYCSDPSHVEECVAFGAAHGGLSEDEVRRMLKEFTEGSHGGPGDFRPPEDFRRFEEEAQRRFQEFRALEDQFRGQHFGPPAGEFSGGDAGQFPGGPPGAPGFVGPGGCASPAECIKYCSEHKEECFSFGPPGQPDFRPPEGGVPPGHDFPRLRPNLINEVPAGTPRTRAGDSGSTQIRVEGGSGGFDVYIFDSDGIDEFSMSPAEGTIRGTAVYGGGVGCKREFKAERLGIASSQFPLTVKIKDCSGNSFEQKVGPAGGLPQPPEGFDRLRQDFKPPEGFLPPSEGLVPPPPESFQHQESTSGSPTPTHTEDPATRCAEAGGKWTGTTCEFPTKTEPQSAAPAQSPPAGRQGFFAGLIDFFLSR